MYDMTLTMAHPSADADAVFELLTDLAAMARRADSIVDVRVVGHEQSAMLTQWQVRFGDGILVWTERDLVDTVARRFEFELTHGDIEQFSGAWQVDSDGSGCAIALDATLDFGRPALADALCPVAARVLLDNTAEIMRSVLGAGAVLVAAAYGPVEREELAS